MLLLELASLLIRVVYLVIHAHVAHTLDLTSLIKWTLRVRMSVLRRCSKPSSTPLSARTRILCLLDTEEAADVPEPHLDVGAFEADAEQGQSGPTMAPTMETQEMYALPEVR